MISVLSIDGGGMKGIISAKVLIRLEEYLKAYSGAEEVHLADYFDLIAGTSTGSILTALLLCPDKDGKPKYKAKDALELYISKGHILFQKKFLYPVNTCFGLFGSRYNNTQLKLTLEEYFGNIKVSELVRPCLLPAYDMENNKTVFFNSLSSHRDERRNYLLADAVLASTAAPTYFPPTCTFKNSKCMDCLIDGGIYANNPSLCAFIEAFKLQNCKNISDIELLSIGNASKPDEHSYDEVKHWGIFRWTFPLIELLMDASEQTVDYQLFKLYHILGCGDHYMRIALKTKKKIPRMDDTSREGIDTFLMLGDQLVKLYDETLKFYAKKLITNSRTLDR